MIIETAIDFSTIPCPSCKAVFAIVETAEKKYRETGDDFHCPYCQGSMSYGPSEADKLKKQLSREKANHDQTLASRNYERRRASILKRSRDALKGVVTKTKKRVGKGVCPCCNRHFKNLERHMTGQHPEYSEESKK